MSATTENVNQLIVMWLSGFSQGAALASLALAQCQNQQLEHKIQFAILVSHPARQLTAPGSRGSSGLLWRCYDVSKYWVSALSRLGLSCQKTLSMLT